MNSFLIVLKYHAMNMGCHRIQGTSSKIFEPIDQCSA